MTGGEAHLKPGAADRDEEFMHHAIRLAQVALEKGDTPVGSVVILKGRIVGEGFETVRSEKDLTAHAEVKAIREACRTLDTVDLDGCELYTTVEPCFLCSYAIRSTHISRVVTGKSVQHIGGISSHHPILLDSGIPIWPRPPVVVTGVLEKECNALFIR